MKNAAKKNRPLLSGPAIHKFRINQAVTVCVEGGRPEKSKYAVEGLFSGDDIEITLRNTATPKHAHDERGVLRLIWDDESGFWGDDDGFLYSVYA